MVFGQIQNHGVIGTFLLIFKMAFNFDVLGIEGTCGSLRCSDAHGMNRRVRPEDVHIRIFHNRTEVT